MQSSHPTNPLIERLCLANTLGECITAINTEYQTQIDVFHEHSSGWYGLNPTDNQKTSLNFNQRQTLIEEAKQQKQAVALENAWAIPIKSKPMVVFSGTDLTVLPRLKVMREIIETVVSRCVSSEMAALKIKVLEQMGKHPHRALIATLPNGKTVCASPKWKKQFGWSDTDLDKTPWMTLMYPDAIYRYTTSELLFGYGDLDTVKHCTSEVLTKNNGMVSMSLTAEKIRRHQPGLFLNLIEMNALQNPEEEARHSATSREILHEINNHLTSIGGNAELIILKSNHDMQNIEYKRRAKIIQDACMETSKRLEDLKHIIAASPKLST